MDRREFVGALGLAVLAAPLAAQAQPAQKMYRIGVPWQSSRERVIDLIRALEHGLREHGYVEGRNVSIEHRFADLKRERVPALAAELAELNVDVFVVGVDRTAVAVKHVTTKTPIVMANAEDPVGAGLVESLARPGGNITGLTIVPGPEIYGKNLELLREVLPQGSRIAILFNTTSRINSVYLGASEEAARKLGLALVPTGLRGVEDFDQAFATMKQKRVKGFVVLGETLFVSNRQRVNELAARSRLASMWPVREGVDAGGLMSYGTNLPELFRRAAIYVDKILKGARPGDLPMEQPTRFDLVINLKTAKTLGLAIPPALLLRADQVLD
jgi:putative tryptophan/tyrosine transport system substrate-binding protein